MQEILTNKKCDDIDQVKYEKRIVEAHGCSSTKAKEIIKICIEAVKHI